ELSLRAAASFGCFDDSSEENPVNKLLLAVMAALGLPETTTEDQAVAALSAHATNLRELLGLDEKADGKAVLAACTSLKSQTADPAQFVPISVVEGLKGELAALSARLSERDAQELEGEIKAALDDGRLHKTMEQWARDLGKTNRAALTAYLVAAEPLSALAGSQTRGQPPVVDEKTGLNEN